MIQPTTRANAWTLLCEFTESDSLRRHALGVEQAMREMAVKLGGDIEEWGLTGLLHDFDYECFPTAEEHPYKGNVILAEKGYSESIREAIMGHATYTGVPRTTDMAKALFAVDELVGFIFAVTYVRPSRSILEVTPKSVQKKLKQLSFAASVNRQDIVQGMEELNLDPVEHFQFVIDALTKTAATLGLAGTSDD